MSKIINKFIGSGELVQDAINDGELLKAPSQNAVFDALALKINSSLIGAVSGVASLDGSGKVPVSQLPNAIMEYQGNWNASTNSPSLADGAGSAGDVYRVSVAGSQDLGSGSISFDVGDYVIYSGSVWQKSDTTDAVASVNGATGVVVLDTDDISEGATNLYYTAARFNSAFAAKSTTDLAEGTNLYYTAARFNSAFAAKSTSDLAEGSNLYYTNARGIGSVLTGYVSGAGTVAATDTILEAIQKLNGNIAALPGAATYGKEVLTLAGGDITNGFVDLAQTIKANSLQLFVAGVHQVEGASYDYTISLTGGAGGVTRLSFVNGLATGGDYALIAGDKLAISYVY